MAQATLGNGIKLLQLIRDKHCSTAKVEQLLPFFSDLIDASRYLPNRNAFRELLGIETGKYTAEVVYARKTFERRIAENKFAWVDPQLCSRIPSRTRYSRVKLSVVSSSSSLRFSVDHAVRNG